MENTFVLYHVDGHQLSGNLFEQIRLHQTQKELKDQIEFYEKEISESQDLLNRLEKDTATMEQVARENYMMKRDNEVIYLIETQE